MHHVYFLESQRNGKYYVGMTSNDPQERVKEHNSGTNEWTKQNGPFLLRYYESYECKKDAMKREKFYKTGIGRLIRDAILITIKGR